MGMRRIYGFPPVLLILLVLLVLLPTKAHAFGAGSTCPSLDVHLV